MNEFFALSLFVSIFASNAFCMMPSNWKPPAPADVVFGECLFVPGITGGGALMDEIHYSYRHICRQKFTDEEPQPPEHKRNWYIVGTRQTVRAESVNLPSHNYVQIKQGHVQFVFLKGTTVKFVLRYTTTEFEVTFQSAQQRQAFYGLIYRDVVLGKAAPNKIGVLHEITFREDGKIGDNLKLGNNIEALREAINNLWYITFKNEQGEPVLIFSQSEASITIMRSRLLNKLQLLMQAHDTHYILTFPDCVEAEKFSDGLLGYVKMLHLNTLCHHLVNHFKYNFITMDS